MARPKRLSDEEITENLEITREYLKEWKSLVDAMGIWVIEPDARLFDSIAFSLVNKAFRLGQACIRLLEGGFIDEAFGISRSIFECALSVRYLTLDRKEIGTRSCNYVDFFHAERQHFLEMARKYITNPDALSQIEAQAKKEGIESMWGPAKPKHPSDWKAIEGREWTGWKVVSATHALDDELNRRCAIGPLYATYWRASSAMVHCSIRALDNVFAVDRLSYKVGERLVSHYDHSFEPLLLIVMCFYHLIRYALYGANADAGAGFDELLESTSKKLRYKKQS